MINICNVLCLETRKIITEFYVIPAAARVNMFLVAFILALQSLFFGQNQICEKQLETNNAGIHYTRIH